MTELRLGQINTVDIESSEFASANAVNTVQANVTSLTAEVSTISGNASSLPDSAANDYTTYSTLSTLIDTVSENASSHSSTFWEGYADTTALAGGYISNGFTVVSGVGAYFGDGGSWTQLATLASVNTVNDNVTALDNNAWVNANDYSTYNTLSGLIDTVQDNISSSSSTTDLYIDNTLISNSALFIESGNGLSVAANATSKVVTFTVGMSNVTSQEFTANGSSNTFTLAKSVSNSHMILVSYNGILQKPTTYDISGTTLTLSNTLPIKANSDVEVRYFDFFDLPGVTAGSSGGGGGYTFAGTTAGYSTSGYNPAASTKTNREKYSFTSDANSYDAGSLATGTSSAGGQSSSTHGYHSGGSPTTSTLQKFSFTSPATATNIGSLTTEKYLPSSNSSEFYGYNAGSLLLSPGSRTDAIDKFLFTSDTNATDVGELNTANYGASGQSSTTHGYASGGRAPTGTLDIIDKFPFSSDASATDVAELTNGSYSAAGTSSPTHGYIAGGYRQPGATYISAIDKFPFASDASASFVSSISAARYGLAGTSSTTYGYVSGGSLGGFPTVYSSLIEKFSVSSDSNATSVGNLSTTTIYASGQQY